MIAPVAIHDLIDRILICFDVNNKSSDLYDVIEFAAGRPQSFLHPFHDCLCLRCSTEIEMIELRRYMRVAVWYRRARDAGQEDDIATANLDGRRERQVGARPYFRTG